MLNFLKRCLPGSASRSAEITPLPPAKGGPLPSPVPKALPVASKTKPARNPVKDTLFGNLPLEQWPAPGVDSSAFPWSEFEAARSYLKAGQVPEAIASWQTVVATPNLEALHYLQAWHFLRENGVQPPEEEAKIIYGVIGEQGATGMLTAVFVDGQARVYSDHGQSVVWDHPDASLDPLIESILGAATVLVHKIKGNDPQLKLSTSSINTLSLLTPSGNYIKTGAPGILEATPLIKPVAAGLGQMLATLMQKSK